MHEISEYMPRQVCEALLRSAVAVVEIAAKSMQHTSLIIKALCAYCTWTAKFRHQVQAMAASRCLQAPSRKQPHAGLQEQAADDMAWATIALAWLAPVRKPPPYRQQPRNVGSVTAWMQCTSLVSARQLASCTSPAAPACCSTYLHRGDPVQPDDPGVDAVLGDDKATAQQGCQHGHEADGVGNRQIAADGPDHPARAVPVSGTQIT